jgi:Holliday junction resolvasome RuvABC endonuclease subunit
MERSTLGDFMRIVSFDPASLANLGWACLCTPENDKERYTCEAGTFTFSEASQKATLNAVYVVADQFLQDMQPDLVLIEKTSSFSGGFVTGQVSACIGVLLSLCGKYDLDTIELFPTHVKKTVSGSGQAKKPAMKQAVTNVLTSRLGFSSVRFNSEHAYDAVANILSYLIDNNMMPEAQDGKDKDNYV